jgi:pimeloyl-[acyl-carrier protein] methyl ester esterase
MAMGANGVDTVVLLPGLDGTGRLLSEFATALGANFRVKIICYPTHKALDYDGLMELIRAQLPHNDDYVVVGESFSGPLALRLAQEEPVGLKGVVLGASFARLDLPAKPMLSCLAKVISPRMITISMLIPFLLGGSATPELRESLAQVLANVAPQVLSLRVRAALEVDLLKNHRKVQRPVLYLQATLDRLIPKSAALYLADIASNLRIHEIVAPHFLFQVAPDESAAAIHNFRQECV